MPLLSPYLTIIKMVFNRSFYFYLVAIFLSGLTVEGQAQTLKVAAAANTQFVMKALQEDFKKRSGIEVMVITGSSGKLAAQIKNGAPYDLFLSADMDFPLNLYNSGFALTRPKVYALGSLIVCGGSGLDLKNWRSLLSGHSVSKIAIANPALAPYGKAAEQALRHERLWDSVQSKLVLGESISQVNTYVVTGSVPVGFTTEALIHEYRAGTDNPDRKPLQWLRISPQIYEPIRQGLVLLKYSKKDNYAAALKFFNYLSSPAAKELLKQNGYRIP
jgi:molybdate transport system substrate-binding protein